MKKWNIYTTILLMISVLLIGTLFACLKVEVSCTD